MEMKCKKRRSPNFLPEERDLLLSLVSKFKNIIENKKTDAVTWKHKDIAWNKLTEMFNSQTTLFQRTKESLKKFYDNLKKTVRKEMAGRRADLIKTGGGPSEVDSDDKSTQIVLNLINQKTIFGLENEDGDCYVNPSNCQNFEVDDSYIEPFEVAETPPFKKCMNPSWRESLNEKYPPQDGDCELNHIDYEMLELDDTYIEPIKDVGPSSQKFNSAATGLSSSVKYPYQEVAKSDDLLDEQHSWRKRRRPGIQAQNSSVLAEEYSALAKLKLDVFTIEKENVKIKGQREEVLFNLHKRKLELDVEIKKLELKKLKREVGLL